MTTSANAAGRPALEREAAAGQIRADVDAYELLFGIGNRCVGVDGDSRYDARFTRAHLRGEFAVTGDRKLTALNGLPVRGGSTRGIT